MTPTPFQEFQIQILVSSFVVFGGFALMTGQALARTWRHWAQGIGYGVLLWMGARLAEFVLFIGRSQTLPEYVSQNVGFSIGSGLYLVAVTIFAHRVTLARMMVTQYPWLYERAGLFSWRAKG
ncbi:MAG: DUF6867 family protein [Rhodospirillales bacterium]